MRISEGPSSPEKYAAFRAQLRIFFGVPAEIIPDTHEGMCGVLSRFTMADGLYLWLRTHGYEVVQDYDIRTQRKSFMIRPETWPWTGAEAIANNLRDEIDKAVIAGLLGETP